MLGHILIRDDLILSGCKNRLDILEGGTWRIFQCPLTGVLQSLRRVFIRQLQQTHAGLVALLLHLVAAENGLDHGLGVASNFPGPMNEAFPVPLDILLVVGRHMLLDGAVLVESAVQSGMRTDPFPL